LNYSSKNFFLKKNNFYRVKPNNKIKEYQNQEKLLSIVERVAEAYNIHRELNELEAKEKGVVQQKIEKKNSTHQKILFEKHVLFIFLLNFGISLIFYLLFF